MSTIPANRSAVLLLYVPLAMVGSRLGLEFGQGRGQIYGSWLTFADLGIAIGAALALAFAYLILITARASTRRWLIPVSTVCSYGLVAMRLGHVVGGSAFDLPHPGAAIGGVVGAVIGYLVGHRLLSAHYRRPAEPKRELPASG